MSDAAKEARPPCPFKPGDRVVVPKGSPIVHTTHPDHLTETRTTHTVKAVHVDDYEWSERPRLWWAGPSGYWRVIEVTQAVIDANDVTA